MVPASIPPSIGPYRVEGVLGQGGTAIVLRAHDPTLDRPVAVKLVDRLLDDEARARFLVEARAAGRIVHRNVVQVYGVGDHSGRPYIVQELVDGRPLSELLETRGRLSPGSVIDIGTQAAEALEQAALAGVVHRDVKPQNLLVDDVGQVKLTDFGVAKLTQAPSALTEIGTTLGTPHYMSPEQSRGEALDWRADQYSLGATLYHLLAGRPPFDADNTLALLLKHQNEALVPLRSLVPECPPALARAVERMLEKAPEQRFEAYAELLDALDRAAGEAVGEGPEPELSSEDAHQDAHDEAQDDPHEDRHERFQAGSDGFARRVPAALAALATTGFVGLIVLTDTRPPLTREPRRAAVHDMPLPSVGIGAAIAERAPPAPPAAPSVPPTAPASPPAAPDREAGRFGELISEVEASGASAPSAARELGRLEDHRATQALLRALAGANVDLAVAAADALAELGDERALEPLHRAARADSASPRVRLAAEKAYQRLWRVESP
jgi:hypothetical protein